MYVEAAFDCLCACLVVKLVWRLPALSPCCAQGLHISKEVVASLMSVLMRTLAAWDQSCYWYYHDRQPAPKVPRTLKTRGRYLGKLVCMYCICTSTHPRPRIPTCDGRALASPPLQAATAKFTRQCESRGPYDPTLQLFLKRNVCFLHGATHGENSRPVQTAILP